MLREWGSIVNGVAKWEVGAKIVCGKSARWWDSKIKIKLVQEGNCTKACYIAT